MSRPSQPTQATSRAQDCQGEWQKQYEMEEMVLVFCKGIAAVDLQSPMAGWIIYGTEYMKMPLISLEAFSPNASLI